MKCALLSFVLVASFSSTSNAVWFDHFPSSERLSLVQASFDQKVGGLLVGVEHAVLQLGNGTVRAVARAAHVWSRYIRRALKFGLLVLLIGLVDRRLIAAWRVSGIRVLATYVPLMIYVYARLLFDRRVYSAGKILLGIAVAYGVLRRDLVPDHNLLGLVDDVILLVIAVRLLLKWCSDEVVDAHANEAVRRWSELTTLYRVRQR
jgi:uncharacterized membrane protein YkvA (DUF1232 family)